MSESTADYYSHHATVALERPLVVVGFFGSEHRQVAYRLAGRTGLTFVDLDRWIEHEAGCSIWELVATQGETRLRQLESQQLRRALNGKPPAVIALGEGALMAPRSLDAVLAASRLVYLKLDLVNALWQLKAREERQGRHPSPFLPHPLEDVEQLRPIYEASCPAYERAHDIVELAGKHAETASRELLSLVAG